jgi:apolipoprotein N-acyltransferase
LTWVFYNHIWIVVFASLICSITFGLISLLYCQLKRGNYFDIIIFAALWALFDWVRQLIFQDFDYMTISYTAYALPALLSFASIGGIYIVTFIISLINGFVGFFVLKGFNKKIFKVFLVTIFILVFIFLLNKIYLNTSFKNGHEVSFASIQANGNFDYYAENENSIFLFSTQMTDLIKKAIIKSPDYIIYPKNPVPLITAEKNHTNNDQYISASFDDIDSELAKIIPQNINFIYWADTMRKETGDRVYDTTMFYKNGITTEYYEKRNPHPFINVSSNYFRNTGVIVYPYDFTPSNEDKINIIDKDRFSNLSCSELNYSGVARHDMNNGANIILSVGNSWEFEQIVFGITNTVLAQYRAAETNLPMIRSDMRGPSIIVNKDGSVNKELRTGEGNILFAKVFVEDQPKKTLYTYLGNYFIITIFFIIIVYSLYLKFKNKTQLRI